MTTESQSDFAITAYAQNAHILRAMQNIELNVPGRIGCTTVEKLCAALYKQAGGSRSGISVIEREVRELIALKLVPQKPNGAWIEAAEILAALLKVPPEQLWPGKLATTIPEYRTAKLECCINGAVTWSVMELAPDTAET